MFGCASMKKTEFCILNRRYSPEEYRTLRARIVEHMKRTGEWGEFFPIEASPWCYNETAANDFYPLSEDEAVARGLRWIAEDVAVGGEVSDIPDSIRDVGDEILQRVLICELTGRRYKIIGPELKFYRQHGIPIPRWAPETRDVRRLRARNGLHVWERACDRCRGAITTTYSPERPEIVYCEPCYLAHLAS